MRSSLRRLSTLFVFLALYDNLSHAFSTRSNNSRKTPASKPRKRVNKSAQNKRKGYALRSSNGVKTRRKRPPRWETEGDALFFVAKSNEVIDIEGETPAELLANLCALQKSKASIERKAEPTKTTENKIDPSDTKKLLPNFLSWGPLSTGPILSPILQAKFETPTPIQIESFGQITNRKNTVIAAPTGSGKTLAYILPLLCRIPRKTFGAIMIVTPTTELALQIQSVVNYLWPPEQDSSTVFVTGLEETKEQGEFQWILTEMMMANKSAPIIAGTAGSILKWLINCIANGHGKHVLENLETLVLDEADRLLQTEMLARIEHGKKTGAENQRQNNRRRLQKESETIKLLEMISLQGRTFFYGNRKRVQLICASATVGRTLRRQIMDLTDASSVDMGSVLVCADDRKGKDADKRKTSLLPDTIEHTFVLQEGYDECKGPDAAKSVWEVMKQLSPGPALIFPGQMGVQSVEERLTTDCKLKHVRTLENLHESRELLTQGDATFEEWKDTPIFIIGEKFGRGLDIPNVCYVFLAGGPPNSPAAYTHLVGRTGRGGKPGKAITFVRNMKEAKRLVTISHKLGLSFSPLLEETPAKGNPETSWQESSSLSKDELAKLTVPVLKELLKERGKKVGGRKNELVQRLLETPENE